MIIKTYDAQTLQEKETITHFTSIIWNRRFYKNGSFEMETTSNKIHENDIIAYSYNKEIRCGIVMKILETKTGISLSGYDLKGMFNFRYITTPKTYSGTPEYIIKTMASEFLKTDNRDVYGLEIAENSKAGESTTFSPENGFLSKAYETFCLSNEIGISVEFDLQKLLFQTHIGTDRTDTVKFGRRFRNIDNIEYTKDLFNTYNVGYSVDENGVETVTGTAKGLLRRECYKEKNISEYLKEKSAIETLRAEANDKYRCGVDYFLGDYVSVVKDNMVTKKQITEIKEVHERSKHFVVPVFGTEKENPLKKLLEGV